MKKQYIKPTVDKIEFDYSSVVATSGSCHVGGSTYSNNMAGSCPLVETWVGQNG